MRNQVRRFAGGRLRLSVFRSNKHISAQVIDDASGKTVASASSSEKELREQLKNGGNVEAATVVGKKLGERCVQQGITEVVFDRGQYKYHGRVAALADGAREAGLQF
ncbi:50S ribosomal protein L18 [Planctomycetia bacterium]|nr:50S ribosomal protein L18 [Planctomycetia bacterium]